MPYYQTTDKGKYPWSGIVVYGIILLCLFNLEGEKLDMALGALVFYAIFIHQPIVREE